MLVWACCVLFRAMMFAAAEVGNAIKMRMVFDAATANEVDDPYAIVRGCDLRKHPREWFRHHE